MMVTALVPLKLMVAVWLVWRWVAVLWESETEQLKVWELDASVWRHESRPGRRW